MKVFAVKYMCIEVIRTDSLLLCIFNLSVFGALAAILIVSKGKFSYRNFGITFDIEFNFLCSIICIPVVKASDIIDVQTSFDDKLNFFVVLGKITISTIIGKLMQKTL